MFTKVKFILASAFLFFALGTFAQNSGDEAKLTEQPKQVKERRKINSKIHEKRKKVAEENSKREKKAIEAAKKRHERIQTKKTRKRMKRRRDRAGSNYGNRNPSFWQRLFKKKKR